MIYEKQLEIRRRT